MRRWLAFISGFLMVAGLELSTQAVTLVLARLRAGFGAVLAGTEFHVPALRFGLGVGALLVGVFMWGLLIWSHAKRDDVATVGPTCPQCGNRTRRVKRREWQRLLAAVLGERLSRRRCETCGWTGLSAS